MLSENQQRLERIRIESRAHVKNAHASNEDTRQHIDNSREVIARSLQLLGLRFGRLDD